MEFVECFMISGRDHVGEICRRPLHSVQKLVPVSAPVRVKIVRNIPDMEHGSVVSRLRGLRKSGNGRWPTPEAQIAKEDELLRVECPISWGDVPRCPGPEGLAALPFAADHVVACVTNGMHVQSGAMQPLFSQTVASLMTPRLGCHDPHSQSPRGVAIANPGVRAFASSCPLHHQI